MQTIENSYQDQHQVIYEHFIQLVKAPYGDFSGIDQLAKALGDIPTLNQIREFLSRHPEGKRAIQERSRLGKVDLQQLHQLPKNTLGYCYADHMLRNGFNPPPTVEIADNDFVYMTAHIGETHDIWHVVTGCDTDKAGEIKLEAFYVAQIYRSRLFVSLLAKNLLKTAIDDIDLCEQHMDALTEGWLMAKQAKPLFGIQWNQLWETSLEDIRSSLNIAPI